MRILFAIIRVRLGRCVDKKKYYKMSLNPKLKVLQDHREDLEFVLAKDFVKLSVKLCESCVIAQEVKENFDSLDEDHLDSDRRVRYLLHHTYKKVRDDNNVYDRLVRVLSRFGGGVRDVCEVMKRELDRDRGGVGSGSWETGKQQISEKDVSCLTGMLLSGSHLWDEIGIALNLPKYKREDCGKGGSNAARLSNILTAWVLGGSDGARPATLDSLRAALASEIVGLGKLAVSLHRFETSGEFLSAMQECHSDSELEICYQSCDTVVTFGKSTLLEVLVYSSDCLAYRWNKNGQHLRNGSDYFGVTSNLLYINRARQGSEGKYSCWVSNGKGAIYSSGINLTVLYSQEQSDLMELYSALESEVPKDSWPPIGCKTFINLVLIQENPINRGEYFFTIRGDLDDILGRKGEVKYEELFKEYGEGVLMLIEGRPGSGKTTLVHKIARDWATGDKVLRGARMVFLVSLRLLNFSKRDKTLSDLLELFYSDEMLRKSVDSSLQRCKGKGTCFVLDGFDEYESEHGKNSIIFQLIFKKCLPLSMVIVASRPVATHDVRELASIRIEVIGFTKQQIYEYVRSYPFKGTEEGMSESDSMASELIAYLDLHVNVLHMCYLPVHAAIICFLFCQLRNDIPCTETRIYEQFTIATLLRHKRRDHEYVQLKSLKDLCGNDREQFNKLCELAFHAIINSQQVICRSDSKVLQSDGTGAHLAIFGLLTVERTFRHYGVEDLYSFLHLTFQEYLAALYLVELEHNKQKEILKKYCNYFRLRNMWKFYSGLIQFDNELGLFQLMFTSRSSSSLESCRLPLITYAFESQQAEVCDYLLRNYTVFPLHEVLTASDFNALGFVTSAASCLYSNLLKITFKEYSWDDEALSNLNLHSIKCIRLDHMKSDDDFKAANSLLRAVPSLEELDLLNISNEHRIMLLTQNVTLQHLKVLKIQCFSITTYSALKKILKLLKFNSQNIEKLYLEIRDISTFTLLMKCCLSTLLHVSNSDSFYSLDLEKFACTEIFLVNCGIDDRGTELLISGLETSILKCLVLDFNKISDSGAVQLAGCIATCSIMRELSIQCNSIGNSGAIALADGLGGCSTLRRLDLQGNIFGDEGAVALALAMNALPNVPLYLCNVNVSEHGFEEVMKINENASIRTMEFGRSWNCIKNAGIDELRRALKCGSLPTLEVSKSNIHEITTLVTELCHVGNIRALKCTSVTKDTVHTLCDLIKSMNNLQELFLEVYNITPTTADFLLDNCKHVKKLTLWSSFSSKILAGSIKSGHNIHGLCLSWCDGMISLFRDPKSWGSLCSLKMNACNSIIKSNYFSELLMNCKNLCYLNLSNNPILSSECGVLAKALKHCTCIQELHLRGSGIGSRGVVDLADVISCKGLYHLDLSYNHFGTAGLISLSGLLKNTNIKILELSRNGIDSRGAAALVDILNSVSGTLRTLKFKENDVGFYARSFGVGLRKCIHLVELDLSVNMINSQGMSHLAEGLKYCTDLEVLDLSYNNITSDGATTIVAIMDSCNNLKDLNLSSNKEFGIAGATVLVGGWNRKSLLCLDLECCLGLCEDHVYEDNGCSICSVLLDLYYLNYYLVLNLLGGSLPKMLSIV